jgi:hypothetical protein
MAQVRPSPIPSPIPPYSPIPQLTPIAAVEFGTLCPGCSAGFLLVRTRRGFSFSGCIVQVAPCMIEKFYMVTRSTISMQIGAHQR